MIRSMTGYGREELDNSSLSITAELRSLNSKYFDLNIRIPASLKEKEMDLRTLLNNKLSRGKIDCTITLVQSDAIPTQKINASLVKSYYHELKKITDELGTTEDLIAVIMRMPDVTTPDESTLRDKVWEKVKGTIEKATDKLNAFREKEGVELENDLRMRITDILNNLEQVEGLEPERKVRIRERLDQHLADIQDKAKMDEKRYEEEVLYYLEKLDITEEKVRLKAHCKHFGHVLDEEKWDKGKKLNFISQEMGREINTIGSKANDHNIQKVVVQMKDDLEKVKEQLLNVL